MFWVLEGFCVLFFFKEIVPVARDLGREFWDEGVVGCGEGSSDIYKYPQV